jgi:hypothetical protein
MDEDIAKRISRLSPAARDLFLEVMRWGGDTEFAVSPEEVLSGDLLERLKALPLEDRRGIVSLWGDIGRWELEEGTRLQAEAIRFEGFAKLIGRAQELDRQAGRPVNEDMTLEEAIPKLEAAGKLDTLEREYLEAVKGEVVWVPRKE